jgi:hypothetical protein
MFAAAPQAPPPLFGGGMFAAAPQAPPPLFGGGMFAAAPPLPFLGTPPTASFTFGLPASITH